MRTNDQNNTRPGPIHSYRASDPAAIAPKTDRTTYEAARRAELDHIRRLDLTYRRLLNDFRQHGVGADPGFWGRGDPMREDKEERGEATDDLRMRQRILVHAVEGYLLGCVRLSTLTGEIALKQTRNTDELCAALQAEEDLAIKACGPPWVERPATFSGSRLHSVQPHEEGNVPTRGSATSNIPALWRWPWR
jgi:hypothetical protein